MYICAVIKDGDIMVFYFTGTGNSLWVAKTLGEVFDEPLMSIAGELRKETEELAYRLKEDEMIFFVYPVHSWGPALPVMQFIARLRIENYRKQRIYSVATCGDECGFTNDILKNSLTKRGLPLHGSYSLKMPNNYILLPGFNVDTKEVEQYKLEQAPDHLSAIIAAIREHQGHFYQRGSFPFLKSRIIYPLFARYAGKLQGSFYATDTCIACNLCAKICPTGTISICNDGKPQWAKKTCVQCTACIHYCPVRAIEFGKVTLKKGRYHHPEIKNII